MLHLVASNEHNHREIRVVLAVDSNIDFMSFLCVKSHTTIRFFLGKSTRSALAA